MIKPTVGRVVWFHVPSNVAQGGFCHPSEGEPLAAIIANVFSDRLVNLAVFDANGTPHSRTSVRLVQEGEDVPGGGSYAEWMPYQVGQAKKHDNETAAGDAPKAPSDQAIGNDLTNRITGALFDFLGFLTGGEKRYVFSAHDHASPAVDALRDWAATRALSLDEAMVKTWRDYSPWTKPEPAPPVAGAVIRPPHQQRVIDERTELDDKLSKLVGFTNTVQFSTLPGAEQARMRTQAVAMRTYSEILVERIAAF